MYLQIIWPQNSPMFHLSEHYHRENAAGFDPALGGFTPATGKDKYDSILFYWNHPLAMIANYSTDYVCVVDGLPLEYGQAAALRGNSDIQMGNFRVTVQMGTQLYATDNTLLLQLLGETLQNEDFVLPDVDDLLSYGGHQVIYAQDIDLLPESVHDELKILSEEYKNFLVWGEQTRRAGTTGIPRQRKFSSEDRCFNDIRDSMRNKTLTDCLLETSSLMKKVFEELNVSYEEENDIFSLEKFDILLALAPEHMTLPATGKNLPSLILKDFYQSGLETIL
ncbi:TagK domain-containing protein [Buttiauxella agrestis]|uniref:TagK domain-containing protein n=1 Tax=Buttiauxella agrestis TaxID=82977 RepID=UPI00397670A7